MAKRVHMILSDRQYDFLLNERARTGLPIGELVRRAIDTTYRPYARPKLRGFELSFGLYRQPDAALTGRRSHHGSPRVV